MLTLAHIDRMKAYAREHAIKPARISTYARLRKMRRQAKLLRLKHRWRIGDYYYVLWTTTPPATIAAWSFSSPQIHVVSAATSGQPWGRLPATRASGSR